jgi:ABC-2 type transport system ATP-binding protein
MIVGLQHPPAQEALAAIPGVEQVDAEGDGRFRIRFAPDCDPSAALIGAAAAGDWGLQQLTPARSSLEDVFVHLTQDDPDKSGSPA